MLAKLVRLLQDEGNAEIKDLVTLAQFGRHHIAHGATVVGLVAAGAGQAFVDQVVVERLERRVLDDGQHIDQAGRLLTRVDALAVLALEVGVLRVAPHQAQAATYGLLQQDLGLVGAQRHDDADVVDVEALAQHQHADDDARRRMPVDVEQALAHRRPVLLAKFGLLARVDGHDLVVAEAFLLLQELRHQRRYRGVLAHHQHLGMTGRIDRGEVFFQLAQLGQTGA